MFQLCIEAGIKAMLFNFTIVISFVLLAWINVIVCVFVAEY